MFPVLRKRKPSIAHFRLPPLAPQVPGEASPGAIPFAVARETPKFEASGTRGDLTALGLLRKRSPEPQRTSKNGARPAAQRPPSTLSTAAKTQSRRSRITRQSAHGGQAMAAAMVAVEVSSPGVRRTCSPRTSCCTGPVRPRGPRDAARRSRLQSACKRELRGQRGGSATPEEKGPPTERMWVVGATLKG
eukprot:scaffold347_cov239-Pinguiococcus_pyrenoidosus.AAC.35